MSKYNVHEAAELVRHDVESGVPRIRMAELLVLSVAKQLEAASRAADADKFAESASLINSAAQLLAAFPKGTMSDVQVPARRGFDSL